MPKYMVIANYTAEGAKGLLKDGGTARVRAVEKAMKSLGGSVESFNFALGGDDAYILVEAPDHASVVALTIAAAAAGGATARTIALLSPAEVDEAGKKASGADYKPPGS